MGYELDKFKLMLELALHPEKFAKMLAQQAAQMPPAQEETTPPQPAPEESPAPVIPMPSPLTNIFAPPPPPPDPLLPNIQALASAVQRQGDLLSAQVASLAGFLPLMGGRAQNVVTIRDQYQARSYSVQKAITQTVGPVTVGPGVTVTLNNANPLVGSFAIVGVRLDAATNTAGLVRAIVLVNGEPAFHWLNDPIPIWWPATMLDLDKFGGVRVVPDTTSLILGATFENTSAINQVVACTWSLAWLQEDEKPPAQGGV